MEEISNSLRQRNLHRFMEDLRGNGEPNSPIRDPHRIYANEHVYIEKTLADEVSFLFYILFYVRDRVDPDRFEPIYSTYFPDMFKPVNRFRIKHMENGVRMFEDRLEIKTEGAYPLESFVNIIRKHEDIKQMLVSWIDDASKCQIDVEGKISTLKDYTQGRP